MYPPRRTAQRTRQYLRFNIFDMRGACLPNIAHRLRPARRDPAALFLQPDDLARMVPSEAISNDIRRLRTRLFTTFKTGL